MKASGVGLLLVANLVAACGGDPEKAPLITKRERGPEAGRGGSDAAGKGGHGGGGGDAGTDAPQVGPIIEFTKPEPASDPNADTLVTTRDVSVGCRVTARS